MNTFQSKELLTGLRTVLKIYKNMLLNEKVRRKIINIDKAR